MEEKINKIRDLVKEINSYNDVLYMYEGDKIDLDIKKQEEVSFCHGHILQNGFFRRKKHAFGFLPL